jgi:2-polyprenyl-3-methyl-5-hydroxy-6-metoxy-1,4-benzoquinol methylase
MNAFEKRLFETAASPYEKAGKFAKHFAKGKLNGDPVFREILAGGLIQSGARVIDIGCGQGLLSALLLAADNLAEDPGWPSYWKNAPKGVCVKGIELMPADVRRAKKALAAHKDRHDFLAGDMCDTHFEAAQIVVILDVLHYVGYQAQEDVLRRVREALVPNGTLILRVGDAAGGFGFKVSNWVDHVVTLLRGHKLSRLYCRPLADWIAQLTRLGFSVEPKPMSKGTPFANVLLVARAV